MSIEKRRLLIELEVSVQDNGVYGPATYWNGQAFNAQLEQGTIRVLKVLAPSEPPVDTILVDRAGVAWQRLVEDADGPEVWFAAGHEQGHEWEELWNTYGPLKEPWKD